MPDLHTNFKPFNYRVFKLKFRFYYFIFCTKINANTKRVIRFFRIKFFYCNIIDVLAFTFDVIDYQVSINAIFNIVNFLLPCIVTIPIISLFCLRLLSLQFDTFVKLSISSLSVKGDVGVVTL